MEIKKLTYNYQLPNRILSINSFVIFNNDKVLLVDPCDFDKIKKLAKNKQVLAILLTHAHWDHMLALKECQDFFNCPVYCSKKCRSKFDNPFLNCSQNHDIDFKIYPKNLRFVKNKEKLNLSDLKIFVYYFAGHSDCSLIFKIDNNYFVGDSIFETKKVHVDLITSNEKVYQKNYKKFLNKIKNNTANIYCGHENCFSLKNNT